MSNPKKTYCSGLTGVANALASHFQTSVSKQNIQWWKTKMSPPFPAARQNNTFDFHECCEWFEKHIMPSRLTPQGLQGELLFEQAREAEARTKIRKDEESKFDFDVKQRAYIKLSVADRAIIGFAKRFHSWTRTAVERNTIIERKLKLEEFGASPEIVSLFYAFDCEQGKRIIGDIEQQAETFSKESQDANRI